MAIAFSGAPLLQLMEKEMETTIVYWGYIGIMEKKTETAGIGGVITTYFLATAWQLLTTLLFLRPSAVSRLLWTSL